MCPLYHSIIWWFHDHALLSTITPGILRLIGHSISGSVTWQDMCVFVRFRHSWQQRSVQRTSVQLTGQRTVCQVNISIFPTTRMDIFCTVKARFSTIAVRITYGSVIIMPTHAPIINKSSFEIASTTLRLVLFIYCFHFKSAFPPRCWLSPVFQFLFFSFSRNENFSSRGLNNTYDLDLLTWPR